MQRRPNVAGSLITALVCLGFVVSPANTGAQQPVIDQIVGAALTSTGGWTFLVKLTDTIGGRVTGTQEMARAQEFVHSTLRAAALENVQFEEWTLTSRWRRGPVDVRLEGSAPRALTVGSYGWAPGTQGSLRVPIVDVGRVTTGAPTFEAAVRGAAVLIEPAGTASDASTVVRTMAARGLAAAGAVAMLIPSDKPGRMVYTSAFGNYPRAALPMLSIANEDVLLVRRRLAESPVTASLDVTNDFEEGSFAERNVLAEVRGGAQADEIVLVGAHADSWDPGQGALDNGAGVAVLVEAARILRNIDIRPKRTIRFAFWSGEEQGLLGSRAYTQRREGELKRHRAVINFDHGPQPPRGFFIQGRSDLVATARQLLAPLSGLGASDVMEAGSFDTDHAFFAAAGVPVFDLAVNAGDYDLHHHAVSDTVDKVDRRSLAVNTAVIAATAWLLANSDAPMLQLSSTSAAEILQRLGLMSSYRMLTDAQRRLNSR